MVMKRSEAIKNIINVLRLTGNHYCDDSRDEQDAERILKRIELIGMLPPETNLKDCQDPKLQVYVDNIDIPHWVVLGWDNE
jgi:hypothetical protein